MAVDFRTVEPFFSEAGISFIVGSGVPAMAAPQGSIYINKTGSSGSTRMYINTDGSTTWTAFTTAA